MLGQSRGIRQVKADEYAAKILADLDEHGKVKSAVIGAVAWDVMLEIKEIAEKRKVSSNEALSSVLDEVDAKWKAVCRRVEKAGHPNVLKLDGMEKLIRAKFPDTFVFWRAEWHPSREELYEGYDV